MDFSNLPDDAKAKLFKQIEQELDQSVRGKEGSKEESLRSRNIEALIQTPEEGALALEYLQTILPWQKKYRIPSEIKAHDVLWQHLLNKQLVPADKLFAYERLAL